jgi:hypothetical protein
MTYMGIAEGKPLAIVNKCKYYKKQGRAYLP